MLVFFTLKDFHGPDAVIQELSVKSWQDAGARLAILGPGAGVPEAAARLGIPHHPDISTRPDGRPRIDDLFRVAHQLARGEPYAYVNSDIYLTNPARLAETETVLSQLPSYLAVARRWELRLDPQFVTTLSDAQIRSMRPDDLRRGPDEAIDFFLLDGRHAPSIPQFAVGRAGWDNWMIHDARLRCIPVVDLSHELQLIHLDVAPGWAEGKRAPSDPETRRNRQLAGWAQLLTLDNATHLIKEGRIRRKLTWSPVTHLRARVDRSAAARLLLRLGRRIVRFWRFVRTRRSAPDPFWHTLFSPPDSPAAHQPPTPAGNKTASSESDR